MATRGGGAVLRRDGPRQDEGGRRALGRLRAHRITFLAVWLTALTVVSVVAVPAAGALLEAGSPADQGSDADSTMFAKGGQPGGNGNGGGSGGSPASSDGGGSSSSDASAAGGGGSGGSTAEGAGGGSDTGSADTGSGSNEKGNGADSPSADAGGSSESDAGNSAGSDASGSGSSPGSAAAGNGASDGPSTSASAAGGGGTSGSDSSPDGAAAGRTKDTDEGNTDGRSNGNGGSGGAGSVDPADRRGSDRSAESETGGPPSDTPAGDDEAPDDPGAPSDRGNGAGPTVDVSVGPPEDSGQRGTVGQDSARGGGPADPPSSVVTVSVEGVRAGESISVDVSPPAVERNDVAFDGVSATVDRAGGFSLEITTSRERLPGSPAFDPGDGADALGRIRLDHSITNEEVEDVSYRFRVSKDRLRATDTDPEDVALYRHAEGSWNALPTDVVGETPSHYLLEADSPGMSEFAVGAQRPSFETWWAGVSAASVDAGESARISGRVTNDGGADGVYEASLVVDGTVVETKRVTVAAGGTRQVNFERRFDRPGTYEVTIDGVDAGEVSVTEREEAPTSADRTLSVGMDLLLELGRAVGLPHRSPVGPG